MLVKSKRGWELPESAATDESVFMQRRQLVKAMAAGPMLLAAGLPLGAAAATDAEDPSAGLYPAKRNDLYKLDRPISGEKLVKTYNNFYEFGSHKKIYKAAQKMAIRPWEVVIDGLVEKERKIAIDDLLAALPLEERLYRHRCVERWSMAVPWSGFSFKSLVDYAKPLNSAKYVVMETLQDPDTMLGLKQFWYPWPYVEGLTMAEATNDLAFLVTGVYGKPVVKQMGAPLRLAVPWKYGFKSIKSIVRFTFSETRPISFWERLQAREYGFWANVNPEVPHPRWSQAVEHEIDSKKPIPTQLYNGYGEFVADLYKNMTKENLFM
jgi:sulfoxide reductase catalytic subunit YedY